MKLIPLTKGKFAIVDDEDYEFLMQWKWTASLESRGTKWYAIRRPTIDGKRVKVRMHCLLLGRPSNPTDGLVVDHENGDSLDNRRENLQIISQADNMRRVAAWNKKKGGEEPWL